MAPRLTTEGSSWVEPAAPIEAQMIKLSPVEQQCAQVYPCGQWFITEDEKVDPIVRFQHLKRGLARMLYEQPIIAGTIRTDERGAFLVEIPPAPQAGATLYFRDFSNDYTFPTFEQLQKANFPSIGAGQDGLEKLYPTPFPTSGEGDPVWICQLSVLRGGLVVNMAITHLIGDLVQPRAAISSWARESALISRLHGKPEPPLPKQFPAHLFDRTPLTPPVSEILEYSEVRKRVAHFPEVQVLDPTDPVGSARIVQGTFPQAILTSAEEPAENYLRTVTSGMWKIPLQNLKALQALTQANTKLKISVVDATVAFIWQRFYLAKYALDVKEKSSRAQRPAHTAIVFPGDVRQRVNPPLPQGYMGAAVDAFKATAQEEDLLPQNNTESEISQSLTRLATIVRDTNGKWSKERFDLLLRLFQQTPMNVPFLPAGPLDLFITDHTRNAVFKTLDWGHGMTTISQRQPYAGRDFPPGEVTFMPRLVDGGFEVMLCGERIVLQRLLQDELMQRFTENLFMAYNVPDSIAQERTLATTPMARL